MKGVLALLSAQREADAIVHRVSHILWQHDAIHLVLEPDSYGSDGELLQLAERNLGPAAQAWIELLYDLYAYSDPLSHLGRQLAYVRIERSGSAVTIEVTDGIHNLVIGTSLDSFESGLPDDIATEFASRFRA
ncbi:hypothetical protein [Leifsonia sp. AG29]|uniref:hypothetical protein n=1 Tax=Leifsonia sp. AG29 TaxID=2598860 RepID=UPI00131D5776|nr:hypothetical protein [Leifsonia sp. AG29]